MGKLPLILRQVLVCTLLKKLNLENAKDSLDVEGPHHYNIFSECGFPSWADIVTKYTTFF